VKVAVIGAGNNARGHAQGLAVMEDVQVVGIADPVVDKAEALASDVGGRAYADHRVMLDEAKPDAICISSPCWLHAQQAADCLAAGVHVLCEKPTAMDAGEAARMLAAAEAAGRVHMIDHELRFNPNRMHIAELISEGALGEIRHVDISNIGKSWTDPASRPSGDWWSLAEKGGGRLGANGSHQVDLLRWWLGEVAWVSGAAPVMVPDRLDPSTGEPWTATADDLAFFTLEMASGTVVQVFMSGVAAHGMGNATRIFGSEGTITLSNDDERLMFARGGEDFQDITVPDPNAALPGVNAGIWNVSVVALMQELASAIRDGRNPSRGATFADGLANQAVLDAVRLSGAERRWVQPEETLVGS